MPSLLTYKACPFGPLDAVIAIEQLLLKVGGSKSERLGQLHQRLRQVPSSMVNMPLMLESPKQEDELDDTLAVSN
jgi:hypothetical protein